jgi:limonene 1,2-monooxygenase
LFRPKRMKFGAFVAPYHSTDENPTVAFERDLDTIVYLDRMAFDEVWVGEHHSAGWETVAAPDLVLAVAAERTRYIKLGTGVVCMPLHHPLDVAARMSLLDHLTRGRIQMATGPGLLLPDLIMRGLDPTEGRRYWMEGLEAVVRLLTETEPITMEGGAFQLKDALLQIRPYQRPHFPLVTTGGASPTGATLAGRFGEGLLTFGVNLVNPDSDQYKRRPLADLWNFAEKAAEEAGRTISRDGWRFAVPVHLAESREQALEDVRLGAGKWVHQYLGETLGQPVPDLPEEEIIDFMVDKGQWVVGTPDDCADAIEMLHEMSGGFGGLICINLDWAPHQKVLHSYELLARYVMPRYQGTTVGVKAAATWHAACSQEMVGFFQQSVAKAEARFANAQHRATPEGAPTEATATTEPAASPAS